MTRRITLVDIRPPAPAPRARGFSSPQRSRKIRSQNERIPTGDLPPNDFRRILRARWETIPSLPERSETMGRMITAVASTAPVAVDVPEDVAAELAELYAHLTKNPGQLAYAEFTDDDDATGAEQRDVFVKQAKSWATKNDIVFRQGKTTDLPENAVRFRLSAPLTPEQEAEKAEKQAKDKARREAKKAAAEKAAK